MKLDNKYKCTMDQELRAAVASARCSADASFSLTGRLLPMAAQHFPAWNDVSAAFLKLLRQIENPTSSDDAYIHKEHSCQISSRSDLKRRTLSFLPRDATQSSVDSKSSVRLSVTLRYDFHIGWNTSKIISRPNSLRPMRLVTPTWAICCNTPNLGWNRGGVRST